LERLIAGLGLGLWWDIWSARVWALSQLDGDDDFGGDAVMVCEAEELPWFYGELWFCFGLIVAVRALLVVVEWVRVGEAVKARVTGDGYGLCG
jgi:hypothetical protein